MIISSRSMRKDGKSLVSYVPNYVSFFLLFLLSLFITLFAIYFLMILMMSSTSQTLEHKKLNNLLEVSCCHLPSIGSRVMV